MSDLLFKNARVFDGTNADCAEGQWIRVADGRIQEISAHPLLAPTARVIDVGGRTLMPGLIDAHVHAFASDVAVQKIDAMGEAYRAAHAVRMLTHALHCGFTTVRDVGGGNHSLWRALADGLFQGGDAGGDCGLRDPEAFGRAVKAAGFGKVEEGVEQVDLHGLRLLVGRRGFHTPGPPWDIWGRESP